MGRKKYSQQIRVELVNLLYQQIRPGLFAESICAIVLFIILKNHIHQTVLVSWLAFNLIMCGFFRHLLLHFYQNALKRQSISIEKLSRWENLFMLGAFLSGLSWGAIGSILMVEDSLIRQYCEIILLIGITAAANSLYSPIPKVYLAFLIPAFLPLTLFYFQQGGMLMLLGILCCFYMSIMMMTCYYSYRTIFTSFKLRSQNTELFEHLQTRENQLRYQSNHDELTHLPNRFLLIKKLKRMMVSTKNSGSILAVLYLDIDGIKHINDMLGHKIGDKLLIQVTHRIKKCISEKDILARNDSDEFVIIAPVFDEDEGYSLAKLCLESMQKSFSIYGHHFHTSVSIGINFYPKDNTEPELLIRNADIAMYQAKEFGKNNFKIFNEELKKKIISRSVIETKLRSALNKNEFFLSYQPIIGLKTGSVTGVEVLLRWKHPELGLVPPSDFIAIAEESGLILPIGDWILAEAFAQGRKWMIENITPFQLCINLSSKQFKQPHFFEQITQLLQEHQFDPHHLSFEITESIILEDTEKSIALLNKIKGLGITILIDDFGVGYSSLNYLKRLPVDKLKIDRSFIHDIPHHADDIAIVSAIIALGNALNLNIVAEGVETKEHLLFLIEKKCHEAQGFYFSKPITAEALTEFLLKNKKIDLG